MKIYGSRAQEQIATQKRAVENLDTINVLDDVQHEQKLMSSSVVGLRKGRGLYKKVHYHGRKKNILYTKFTVR